VKQALSLLLLHYLRLLAKLQLAKINLLLRLQGQRLTIIGVTGSAGKSSAVLAIEAALKSKFAVKTTAGSNSESGIPLTILGLKAIDYRLTDWLRICLLAPLTIFTNWQTYQIFVVEMGIDSPQEPKNMSYLLKILQPQIGLFLNVSSVHAAFFPSVKAISREKAKLINSLPPSGLALIGPQPLIKKYLKVSCPIIELQPQVIEIPGFLLPHVYYLSFSAALHIATHLGISHQQAISSIQKNFRLPPSRSTLIKGQKSSTIIDSSYNSSPLACQEMLKFLATFSSPRIAVLGDMRELGKESRKEHHLILNHALQSADLVVSVGPQSQKYFSPNAKVHKFIYWWQAADFLKNCPQLTKATLLVKGSQNTIFLEELIKELLRDRSDRRHLCRQSPYWLNLKKSFRLQNS
jgi:UDP-N-acetylmuramoyl-tripeptide--D-alanyl-D-alanine ligase